MSKSSKSAKSSSVVVSNAKSDKQPKTQAIDGSAGVWGCRPESQAATLNAAIVVSKTPVTAKGLAATTGFSVGRIGSHLQSLVWRGYVQRNPQGAGYIVVSKAAGLTLADGRAQHAAQMAAPVVAPKADKPAKGNGKGKQSAKAKA